MAFNLSNPALINLHALYVDASDSHARKGGHVRVAHNPLLGLSSMPFILERAFVSSERIARLQLREDAVFLRGDTVVTPPFTISEGEEVTVRLPSQPGDYPIWVELMADPGALTTPPVLGRPTLGPLRPVIGGLDIRPNFGGITVGPPITVAPTVIGGGAIRGDVFGAGGVTLAQGQPSAMTVDAYLPSTGGNLAFLGRRNAGPFAFSGPGIRELEVRGRGTIVGMRWINGMQAQKLDYQVIDVMNLPHPGGLRYLNLSNWQALSDKRRDMQSPHRRPLQDTLDAPAPFAASPFAEADESDRVDALFDGIELPLSELITHPTSQIQQMTSRAMKKPDGTSVSMDGNATLKLPTLALVLQSQADPGVASYMGYKSLDAVESRDDPDGLHFYRLSALFERPTEFPVVPKFGTLTPQQAAVLLLRPIIQQHQTFGLDQAFDEFITLAKPFLDKFGIQTEIGELKDRPFMPLAAQAVADCRAPLLPVQPPALEVPRHRDWLPSLVTDPVRDVETGVNGLVAGANMAAGRRQPPGGGDWRNLNTETKPGSPWHALIAPGQPAADPLAPTPTADPAQSFVSDRTVGPGTFSHHVAQQDRFGRYSDWARRDGAAGPRPKPPRPVVMATYAQPDMATGLHAGRVTATIPMPKSDALAPGSFPLLRADITVMIDGQPAAFLTLNSPASASIVLPQPAGTPATAAAQRGLRERFDGPNLANGSERVLTITAVWVDTASQVSVPSEPAVLRLVDPYPPLQTPIPDVLLYSARPDTTGQAWVERNWAAASGNVAYAVYYADEGRMRDHLRNSAVPADGALLTNLEAQDDPAARATLLRSNQGRFPDFLFERLKDSMNHNSTTGQAGFRHSLSGSLRVLNGYKIVAENALNSARPDLSTVDTVFYGVPNSDPPARPTITARLVAPETGEPPLVAELTVTLRTGVSEAKLARIRRTRSGTIDPVRNPIVGTAMFGPVDPVTGLQTATYRDIGAALIAPAARLSAFVKYAWIAEAQGAPEPGSTATPRTVEGLWSRVSPPVSVETVPNTAPGAPTLQSHTRQLMVGGIRDLNLTFSGPADLGPTPMGDWTITVLRLLPGSPAETSEHPSVGTATWTVAADPNPNRTLPTGTKVLVFVTDPLGRPGAKTEFLV